MNGCCERSFREEGKKKKVVPICQQNNEYDTGAGVGDCSGRGDEFQRWVKKVLKISAIIMVIHIKIMIVTVTMTEVMEMAVMANSTRKDILKIEKKRKSHTEQHSVH